MEGRSRASDAALPLQHRRYLLVVTQGVRDEQGNAVERDPAFDACITQPDGDYCDRLAATVLALDDPSLVVAASLFTTLSATAWIEGARCFWCCSPRVSGAARISPQYGRRSTDERSPFCLRETRASS